MLSLGEFLEQYTEDARLPVTDTVAELLESKPWLLELPLSLKNFLQYFHEEGQYRVRTSVSRVLSLELTQTLLQKAPTYLAPILSIPNWVAKVWLDEACQALIKKNPSLIDQFLTLPKSLSDLLLDPTARQDLQFCEMAKLLTCNEAATKVLQNRAIRLQLAKTAFSALADSAFRHMSEEQAEALLWNEASSSPMDSLYNLFSEHKGPATNELKTFLQQNTWLSSVKFTREEFERVFPLKDGSYSMRNTAARVLTQEWIQKLLQKSPIYLLAVLHISVPAAKVCVDAACQAIIKDNLKLLNTFLSLNVGLSKLLLDHTTHPDLAIGDMAQILSCNEAASHVLQNWQLRRLLASKSFALVADEAFSQMTEAQAEALLSNAELPWQSVASLASLLHFAATHTLEEATAYAEWLNLPLIQTLLERKVIIKTSDYYNVDSAELWQQKNAIWQMLTPQSQAKIDMRYFLKLATEFAGVNPDTAAQFLNDPNYRSLLEGNKISLSTLAKLHSEHARILDKFKTRLGTYDCYTLVQRDRLIECLQGYLGAHQSSSGKTSVVSALLDDLRQGTNPADAVWKTNFEGVFNQGRLQTSLQSVFPGKLSISQLEPLLKLPSYAAVSQPKKRPPNLRLKKPMAGVSAMALTPEEPISGLSVTRIADQKR